MSGKGDLATKWSKFFESGTLTTTSLNSGISLFRFRYKRRIHRCNIFESREFFFGRHRAKCEKGCQFINTFRFTHRKHLFNFNYDGGSPNLGVN